MAIEVWKFGGTSQANDDQINAIADHLIARHKSGNRIIVILSARGKSTDKILARIQVCGGGRVNDKILDFGAVAGEMEAAATLAGAIELRGIQTQVGDGRRIGLIASGQFGDGLVRRVENPGFITKALDEHKIVILAAYAGVTVDGETITLGRGGSDTFAVAVAAAIGAETCYICTDVPGFFTIDPHIVPKAKMFNRMTYQKALGLCIAGVQVLKERCLHLAAGLNVKIQIQLSPSFNPAPWEKLGVDIAGGTKISSGANLQDMEATELDQPGIAINNTLTVFNLIGLPNKPGISASIFGICDQAQIPISEIAQSLTVGSKANITFAVNSAYASKVRSALQKISLHGAKIHEHTDLVFLIIVDPRMATQSGWVGRITRALAKADINIEIHPKTGESFSVAVAKKQLKKAAIKLAEEFKLCR